MKKVFSEELPKYINGRYKGKINWKESIGYKIRFIYDDIEGEIEIIDYHRNPKGLYIKYLDKDIFKINTNSFQKGALGKLLDKVTVDHKIEIGTVFKDSKRNIVILNKEHREYTKGNGSKQNRKWYRYKCNKCDWEDYIDEYSVIRGRGCSVCCSNPAKIILGYNTIWDTNKWMCDLGVSEKDAKKYTAKSGESIIVKCPDCGKMKNIIIGNLYWKKTIGCICNSTGISYPEKIIFSVFEQLKINFMHQLSKRIFKWCENRRYDFYSYLHNCIIEVHGMQHYEESCKFKKARTVVEEQKNDEIKKELALANGIKEENYIVIDCRYSELEWIKTNIMNSKLNDMFDLDIIDWLECERFALSNLVKQVCEYYNKNLNKTVKNISGYFKLNETTIINYLKKGKRVGWCDYEVRKPKLKSALFIK